MTAPDDARNLPLWGLPVTHRYMWVPILGAFAMALLLLGMPVMPANSGMLALAWNGLAVVGVFALIVFRAQAKRIQRLEERLAQLERASNTPLKG